MAAVSSAAITLSKASGDELGTSAENLVGIMNQFNLKATEADRVINVLAAGQAVGASSITQTAEAYKNFGAVAKGANITLEQSTALVQTLGKFSIFGAEAGTKLRGATLQLQKAGLGYKSGQFQINDALAEANKMSQKFRTEKERDAFVLKTFGAENITVGKILIGNIKTFQDYTAGVTGTSEAQKAADINSATLANRINELKISFINMLISNDKTNEGLNYAKDIMKFLADNIETVVAVVGGLALAYAGLQAILLVANVYTFLSSVAMGVLGAVTGTASVAIGSNTVAMGVYNAVSAIMTAVTWLANSAFMTLAVSILLALLPIVLIVAGILALIAIFLYWDEICAWFGKQWDNFTTMVGDAWTALTQWFENFSFADLFMDIGQSIINFMLLPLKSVLELVALIPGKLGDAAQMGLDKINQMTDLSMILGTENKQLESPEQVNAQNGQENRVSGGIDVNIKDKGNNVESANPFGKLGTNIPVNLTSTTGAFNF